MIKFITDRPSLTIAPFRYGGIIVGKYRAFSDAENEIQERLLVIEATWTKISQQLTFLQRIWASVSEENQDYLDLQNRIILILQKKLEAATLQINKIEKQGSGDDTGSFSKRKAAKYALVVKESLEAAILDLQTWQREFDTTWFLVLRIANGVIDTELVERPGTEKLSVARGIRESMKAEAPTSVFLPEERLASAIPSNILHSTLQTVQIPGTGSFILDSADCSAIQDTSTFAKYARQLVSRLREVEANTFHILKCKGVVRKKNPSTKQLVSFDFVFNMPKGCSRPRSLRSILLSQVDCSLGDKMSLAKQLATSINFIHVLDFVHKSVRPETILVFQDSQRPAQLGPLFLLGFKSFRTADGRTQRLGSSASEENIYQHPERRGIHPEADYIMQHDIYSLGVCLLEIGLWESFVGNEKYKHILGERRSPKDQYMALAKDQLPGKMGEKYTKVVVNCLSCIDTSNEDFGDESEFQDSDGILIGVKYIEKVCIIYEEEYYDFYNQKEINYHTDISSP
jgi:hypothetical protein